MANELLSCSLSKRCDHEWPWAYELANDSAFADWHWCILIPHHAPSQSSQCPSSVPASYVAECPSRSTGTPPFHRRPGGGRSCWTRGPRRPCPAGYAGIIFMGDFPTHGFHENKWIWVILGTPKKIKKNSNETPWLSMICPWWTSHEINSRHDFGRCSMKINIDQSNISLNSPSA